MDLGAHFRCCDFQVHTPRDRNWSGDCPVRPGDRIAFAERFIAACRAKNLDAVAITDHHDAAFLPYIINAAQNERAPNGERISPENRITIFPGLELTLGLPCQVLLIFDSEVDAAEIIGALTVLGISPAPSAEPKSAETTRLEIRDLNTLRERLAQNDALRDKFIILPNVNDRGSDSILREGFFQHYRDMHCVGGYVDGEIAGHAKRQIIDGNEEAWGLKKIGVIQTSDSRSADFSQLGAHPTWIKWSEPTAEAIRQACLSPASRLRYTQPALPATWVSRIEVTASRYFGSFALDLNPQVNSIIGGRGSGKSTILEYLRWALCDQPYNEDVDAASEMPDYMRRRNSLISSTLTTLGGEVSVHLMRNGVPHRIRRDGKSGSVYLRIGQQSEEVTTEEVVQGLAAVQGYSQKQL